VIDVLRTVLIMSISGSVLAVLFFVLKPLIRDRLPKAAQYYLWLVVIAALLLPVSSIVKLPAATENPPIVAMPSNMVDRYVITVEEELDRVAAIGTVPQVEGNQNDTQATFSRLQDYICSPLKQ